MVLPRKRARFNDLPASRTLDHLLYSIGRGASYISEAEQFARATLADGFKSKAIASFASLGNWGKSSQNEERDLHKWAQQPFGLKLEPYNIWLDLERFSDSQVLATRVQTLAIHELFHAVHAIGDDMFRQVFLGAVSQEFLREFWLHVKTLGEWRDHPHLQDESVFHRLIPILLHFDGAEMHTNTEYNFFTCGYPFAEGNFMDTKLLNLAVPSHAMSRDAVQKKVQERVAAFTAHCFEAGYAGIFPNTGFYGEELTGLRGKMRGQPLAGGWRCCYLGFNADSKARHQVHNFERFYNTSFICDTCCAGKPGHKQVPDALNFKNFARDAAWRLTKVSHRCYLRYAKERSPWCIVPGFTIYTAFKDWLRNTYLGFVKCLLASILADMRDLDLSPDSDGLEGQLRMLWQLFCASCKKHHLPAPRGGFTTANTGFDNPAEFAELGRRFKAGTVKQLLFFFVRHLRDLNDNRCAHAYRMVWSLAQCVHILDVAGPLLTPDEANKAYTFGYQFLDTYQYVAGVAATEQKCRYFIPPKMHYWAESVDDMLRTRLNPRLFLHHLARRRLSWPDDHRRPTLPWAHCWRSAHRPIFVAHRYSLDQESSRGN